MLCDVESEAQRDALVQRPLAYASTLLLDGTAMSSARIGDPMDMTERDHALEPFDALIGTWATEAKHVAVDDVVHGSVTFESLEGGHFLLQRSHSDHELFRTGSASSALPRPRAMD